MSTTPRQYLYTAEDIYGKDGLDEGMSRDEIWHAYEAARAKDAELIQRLVDEVAAWMQPNLDERFRGEQWHQSKRIVDAAAYAAGFKPTQAE